MASRRDDILRVSASSFAKRGFNGVSIDEIGDTLGITGPALYHHFRSKDAILAELLLGISQTLLTGGRRKVNEARSIEHALHGLVLWQIDFAISNPDLITIHNRDLRSLPASTQHRVRRLQREYVALWVESIIGVYRTSPAEALAATHAVFGLINSTPHSARLAAAEMRHLLTRMAQGALSELAERAGTSDARQVPPIST